MLKNIKKRITALTCLASVISSVVLFDICSIDGHAWNSDSEAYDKSITVNENGDWVVTFYDKQHTGNIWYTTEGYTITFNDTSYSQQLLFDPTQVETHYDAGTGMVTTQKTIPKVDVESALNTLDSTGDLLSQYKSGDYSNIRLDGLMSITHKVDGIEYSSWRKEEGNYNFAFPDDILSKCGSDGLFDLSNEEELKAMINAYGWSAKTIEDLLKTHSNKNLYNDMLTMLEKLEKEAAEDKVKISDPKDSAKGDGVVSIDHMSGRNYPIYKTYNTTDRFNLSEGIPSGESFTNGVKADVWYGQYGWTKVEGVYNIPVTVTFKGTWWHYVWHGDGTYNEFGRENGYTKKEDYDWSSNYTFILPREYMYYYLSYIDTYLLDSLLVKNGSYDIDKTYHNGIGVSTYASHDSGKVRSDNVGSVYIGGSDPKSHTIKPSAAPVVDMGYRSPGSFNPRNYRNVAEDELGGVETWNDFLKINNKVYIDDTHVAGNSEGKRSVTPTPADISESDYAAVQYESTQGVSIPKDRRNGAYSTALNATYKSLRPSLGRIKGFSSNGKNCILSGYEQNESVIVHTPVISPVKIITDGTDGVSSQLIEKNSNGGKAWDGLDQKYWLRLDGTYSFQFQPYKWLQDITGLSDDDMIQKFGRDLKGYSEGKTTTKFDKYVKWKRVKFPFDVCINGVYYEVGDDGSYTDDVTGKTYSYLDTDNMQHYTKWVYLPTSSAATIDFYIPSWADESTTTFANKEGYYDIKYEVAAYNVVDQFSQNNEEKKEENENSKWNDKEVTGAYSDDDSKYVATYKIAANVSGWIYDFQVVGTTNASIYDRATKEENEGRYYLQKYSFVLNKEEKKAGIYNRLGTKEIRYTLDGLITADWKKKNTISLSKGRSKDYKDMGGLWKGQYFTFNLKTIGNLWGAADSIEILPNFRFVDVHSNSYRNDDKDESNDVQFYYCLRTGEQFYKLGSDDGQYLQFETRLGDEMFEGAYYDGRDTSHGNDDLTYSAKSYYPNMKDPNYYYLNKTIASYNLEKIKLSDTLRILSGNLEQLNGNLGKNPKELQSLGQLHTYNGSPSDVGGITDLDTQFHNSMQTWHGEYFIPDQFYVVKKEKLEEYIVPDGNSKDLDKDGDIDLDDYAKAHYTDESHEKIEAGITKDAPIFEKAGYVIINFDIKSYNEGKPHLIYSGGNNNGGMWTTEAGGKIPNIETGGDPDLTIPGEPGDVAIVELEHCIQDKYSSRILFVDR